MCRWGSNNQSLVFCLVHLMENLIDQLMLSKGHMHLMEIGMEKLMDSLMTELLLCSILWEYLWDIVLVRE